MSLQCPIHLSDNCLTPIDSFKAGPIEKTYKEYYQTDVSLFFRGQKTIQLYKCNITDYRFFLPETLAGGSDFYTSLAKTNNYFLSWKWEFEKALPWLTPGGTILEIGCGNGNFLIKAKEKAASCTGIDFTKPPRDNNDITFIKGDFFEFLEKTENKYDSIVLFQILEHCHNIKRLFDLLSERIVRGGRLIIAVPNNESMLVKDDPENILNFPPHHMGWWTPPSLNNTVLPFGYKLLYQKNEPLQKYHFDRYYYLKSQKIKNTLPFFGSAIDKVFFKKKTFILNILQKYIKGHTFISVFEKT